MEHERKYMDEVCHFSGHWGMPSLCGLMIRRREQGAVVVFTEMYEENPGSSVTGMIESLASEIVKRYGLDAESVEFIVHNPERSSRYEFFAETFYRAKMLWNGEKFHTVTWERLEELTI